MDAALDKPWRTEARARIVLSILLVGGVGLAFVHRLRVAFLPTPLDINEGWNAFHAMAALRGPALYPPGELFFNNYPPLSFYLVGAAGRVVGDNILAGRLVSLLALIAIAFGIAALVRALTGAAWRSALVPALIFAAVLLLFSHYPGMNDPQLLAHAIAGVGLFSATNARRTLWTASWLLLAFFTKHTLVAAPLAVLAWYVLHGETRRQAGVMLALFASGFTAGVALMWQAYGTLAFEQILQARGYSVADAWHALTYWSANRAPLLALMLAGVWHARRDRSVQYSALYFAFAFAIGAVLSGGVGTDRNVYFDADIALALTLGVVWQRVVGTRVGTRSWSPQRLTSAWVVLTIYFALSCAVVTRGAWLERAHWVAPRHQQLERSQQLGAELRAINGVVLCADLAACYWAAANNRTLIALDPFNYVQHLQRSAGAERMLVDRINAEEFDAIVLLEANEFAQWPSIQRALREHYQGASLLLKRRTTAWNEPSGR